MRSVALAEVKDDLSGYLRIAVEEEVIITRHGKVAGILIALRLKTIRLARLENDRRFTLVSRPHLRVCALDMEFDTWNKFRRVEPILKDNFP